MASTIKVNTIQNTCGADIIKESSNTITIGASGDTVTLASGASQSGFGRSGSVDWQTTPKTATFTAVNGEGYFINQSSAITANLPAGSAGAIVAFSDYARNFATYNLTVSPNGSEKIGGTAGNAILNVNGQAATFVYVDSTKGWVNVQNAEDTETGLIASFVAGSGGTESTVCSDYKVHVFTGPGTFTITNAGNALGSDKVDYLVLAGGGGGGHWYGAGGGAGGYRFSDGTSSGCYSAGPSPLGASGLPVCVQAYPITVGSGGAGGVFNPVARGTSGGTSSFSSISSAGGGSGGGNSPGSYPTYYPGGPGGSGGGAKANPNFSGTLGVGNTPPTNPPQGHSAGSSNASPENNAGGGGAGGASNPAPTDTPNTGGYGGVGLTSSITGSPVARGGGGSGNGSASPHGNANPTGYPFGGGRSNQNNTPTSSGQAETGGGGAGGFLCAPNSSNAGNGGSGIVIIRYKFQ